MLGRGDIRAGCRCWVQVRLDGCRRRLGARLHVNAFYRSKLVTPVLSIRDCQHPSLQAQPTSSIASTRCSRQKQPAVQQMRVVPERRNVSTTAMESKSRPKRCNGKALLSIAFVAIAATCASQLVQVKAEGALHDPLRGVAPESELRGLTSNGIARRSGLRSVNPRQ